MVTNADKKVCPVEKAGSLDNRFRKLLQNPTKILGPYLKPGMVFLDLGCGPGYFSIAAAQVLNGKGKVIAADLQEGMLEIVRQKIKAMDMEDMVFPHKCGEDQIGIQDKVDMVLAFYVVHEIPDKEHLYKEFHSLLQNGGLLLISEPLFHVSKNNFEKMVNRIIDCGFVIVERPGIFFSRSILLRKKIQDMS